MSKAAGADVREGGDPSYQDFLDEQSAENGPDTLDIDAILDSLEGAVEGQEGAEEEPSAEADASEGPKGVGTEDVIERLDTEWPAGADAVRSVLRQMGRNQNEFNELKGQMLDVRQQLVDRLEAAAAESESEPAPEVELPEGVTQDHMDRFLAIGKALGFELKSERQELDAAGAADGYAGDALKAGVEEYGEAFGTIDEAGDVVLNSDVKARLDQRLEKLRDPTQGITALDLFRLEFPGAASQESEPAKEEPSKPAPRKVPGPKARVVRRSSGGTKPLNIYDPDRGDTPDDVIDRAWALSRKELA